MDQDKPKLLVGLPKRHPNANRKLQSQTVQALEQRGSDIEWS